MSSYATVGNGIELRNEEEQYAVIISYVVWQSMLEGPYKVVVDDDTYWVLPNVNPVSAAAHAKRGIFEANPKRPDVCVDGAVLTEFGLQVCRDIPKELSPHAKKVLAKKADKSDETQDKLRKQGLQLLRNWPADKRSAAMLVGTSEVESGFWAEAGSNLSIMRNLLAEGYVEMGVTGVRIANGDVVPTKYGATSKIVWRKTPAGEMRGL